MSITIGNWDTGIYRPDLNISKGREKQFVNKCKKQLDITAEI